VPIKKNKKANKENVNPVASVSATATAAATAAATAREFTFCRGKFHSFQECPKAAMMREFDKMGIKSVEQIKALSANKDPVIKKVTMYSRANEEDVDDIEITCMTHDRETSPNTVTELSDEEDLDYPDLIDDLSDSDDEDEKELTCTMREKQQLSVMLKLCWT
jgi:hypothetical protein